MRGTARFGLIAALLAGLVLAGCGDDDDDDGGGSGGGSINVAMVDNSYMKDIAKLTPELFTKKTDIKVNYTILDETTLRQVTTRDVAGGGRPFEMVLIGTF
jgi:polyol transport system substrate-binding protein